MLNSGAKPVRSARSVFVFARIGLDELLTRLTTRKASPLRLAFLKKSPEPHSVLLGSHLQVCVWNSSLVKSERIGPGRRS